MQYFYTSPECISGNKVEILGEEVAHITKALRHKTGDEIKVTDGNGIEYTVVIEQSQRDRLVCSIIEKKAGAHDPTRKLTLFQAVPKQGRMDLIIEKVTELGVYKIVPIITKYSVCIPKNEENRFSHWNRVAINAMKQSMGTILPKIEGLTNFNNAIKEAKSFDLSIIAHYGIEVKHIKEVEAQNIESLQDKPEVRQPNQLALFIGPEGGFSNEEIELAIQNNVIPVSFGVKRLRSETAAIVGCTILLI